jgi:hypothetical protein
MNRTNRIDVMTETTAPTGASTSPVEAASAEDSAIPDGEKHPPGGSGEPPTEPATRLAGSAGEQTLPIPDGAAARGPAAPIGGRDRGTAGEAEQSAPAGPVSGSASVPINSFASGGPAAARPAFTRPPGMVPPPDHFPGDPPAPVEPTLGVPASMVLSAPTASGYAATAPVSAPPRATGRVPAGGVTVRPIGAAGPGTAVGAAQVTERVRPRPAATPRGPRRARLGIKRIDPWSVMKFSFAVSLVMFIVVIVAASVLYLALDTMGVFESINSTVADLVDASGGESSETFLITAQGVIGTAAVLGALNVLLFTSLATLGAFIYNVCADLVGGIEVTLAERD